MHLQSSLVTSEGIAKSCIIEELRVTATNAKGSPVPAYWGLHSTK